MRERHRARVTSVASFTRVDDLEGSVRALDQLLNARFHLAELLGGCTEILHAFLEQRQCALQLDLVGIQLPDDLFQALELLFEAHDGFTSVTRAPTSPSRSV